VRLLVGDVVLFHVRGDKPLRLGGLFTVEGVRGIRGESRFLAVWAYEILHVFCVLFSET